MKYQYSPEEQAFMQDTQERKRVYSVEECVQHGIDFFERNNLPWFEVDLDLLHMDHCTVCMAGQLAGNFRLLFWDIAHDFELSWVVARTMKFCAYLGLSVYNEEDYPALQAEWVRRIHLARKTLQKQEKEAHVI